VASSSEHRARAAREQREQDPTRGSHAAQQNLARAAAQRLANLAAMPTSAEATQLFAVTERGAQAVESRASGPTVHDVLDELPIGVYSALRTFRHDRFLWLDAHFDRTERSMRALGWTAELDRQRLRRAMHETVSAYPTPTRACASTSCASRSRSAARPRTCSSRSRPTSPCRREVPGRGVSIDLAPHLHRKTPKVKTTDFVRERRPFPLGTQERYEHLQLDDQGRALECSSSNIAFIRGNELVSAGSGVLEGITFQGRAAPRASLGTISARRAASRSTKSPASTKPSSRAPAAASSRSSTSRATASARATSARTPRTHRRLLRLRRPRSPPAIAGAR
jgi:hypothetical protein